MRTLKEITSTIKTAITDGFSSVFSFLKLAVRVISYIFLYMLFTIILPFLPTALMMWYKSVLNNGIKIIDFVSDITISIVGIVLCSLWSNIWLEKHSVSKEVKYLAIGLRFFVILTGYFLYSFVYDFKLLTDFSPIDLNAPIPLSFFIVCGSILLLNAIWDLFFEIKARYGRNKVAKKEDSINE